MAGSQPVASGAVLYSADALVVRGGAPAESGDLPLALRLIEKTQVDTDTAAQLYAHRPFLLRIAELNLGDRDLAEDVVQETLIAGAAGIAAYSGTSTLKTWLVGILRHKIVDALRSRARRPINASVLAHELALADIDALFERGHEGVWESPPTAWEDPVRDEEERDFLRTLELCLARLPSHTARAFMLRELFDLSTREVCRHLGITGNNLGVLLYRARMSLRACLEVRWFDRPRKAYR